MRILSEVSSSHHNTYDKLGTKLRLLDDPGLSSPDILLFPFPLTFYMLSILLQISYDIPHNLDAVHSAFFLRS